MPAVSPSDLGRRTKGTALTRFGQDECRRAVMSAVGVAAEVYLLSPGTLPRTSSGKLRRREALRRFESNTLDAPKRVTPVLMGRALLENVKGYRKSS